MSARESAAELQRVAQAIALSEAFQLLVLECEGLPPGGFVGGAGGGVGGLGGFTPAGFSAPYGAFGFHGF